MDCLQSSVCAKSANLAQRNTLLAYSMNLAHTMHFGDRGLDFNGPSAEVTSLILRSVASKAAKEQSPSSAMPPRCSSGSLASALCPSLTGPSGGRQKGK